MSLHKLENSCLDMNGGSFVSFDRKVFLVVVSVFVLGLHLVHT